MKRLLTSLALAASLILTSCSDGIDDAIFDVAPGLDIYRETSTVNSIAQDGVSIAFRLAILLEELEDASLSFPADGSALDVDDLESFTFEFAYNGTKYNKKKFLFGSDDTVTLVKSDSENNTYYITYGNTDGDFGSGTYDSYYRSGTFKVVTDGKMLNLSDSQWYVSIEGNGIYYASGSDGDSYDATIQVLNADGDILGAGNGVFEYSIGDVYARYTSNDDDTSDWTISSAEFIVDGLGSSAYTLANSIGQDQTLDIYGSGQTLSDVAMSYETISPVTYNPASNLYAFSSGTIESKFTGKIPSTYYESDTVEVEFFSVGAYVVRYNGYTYYN